MSELNDAYLERYRHGEAISELTTQQDWGKLKQQLIEAVSDLGVDKIGFTTADPFLELKEILLRHRELGRESGFEEPDLNKRTDPSLSLAKPRSIISIAVAYPSKLNNPPRSAPEAYRGMLSRSAWGEDYHHVLRDRLQRIEAFILERVPDARIESMVDTGSLSDRAVAERAGVGWMGKNCSLITPEFGSWVYLGEMITNIPFPPDTPITEDCGECTLCLDACPTGALVGPGQLDSGRCLSFITQTKGVVPIEFREEMGNRLYGCDTCQVVCPKNKGQNWSHHPELQPNAEQVKPLLKPILTLTNKEFKEKFGTSSAAWRGKKPIQRNAIIGLAHFKDVSAVPDLAKLLQLDTRPEIRATAAWVLGQIGDESAQHVLHNALTKELEPMVKQEIDDALKKVDV